MSESVQDAKSIRMPAVAIGLFAGFGVAYLASYIADRIHVPEGIPNLAFVLTVVLLPIIVLAAIAIILWIRDPSSENDALLRELVVYFWIPFFILYYVTYTLHWLNRVG
ncbi:MAG: hypothetical protein JSV90_07780 [Methanobacteriota archaeon]|nr:MAG: hypothetical protein JSV90_07780 [Euryarchaeota archaeon]